MRSSVHHSSSSRAAASRRFGTRPLSTASRSLTTRSRAEHAEIARASSAWERDVALGLQVFIGQTIPLSTHEGLRVTHVLNLAEDETFAGWYNWRGITNPDMVLLGVLVGGPDDGAAAAIAVDAKLSARSTKTQVLTDTLALLLEPFQPLTNLVDSLLGDGASERLVLRNGFHVVRGVATTIGTTPKSTRALLDPEFAAEFTATRPISIRSRHRRANSAEGGAHTDVRPTRPTSAAPDRPTPVQDDAALLTETVWSLDRWCAEGGEMPEPEGVYRMEDVLALDDRGGAPAEIILLGRHGAERVAQCVVLGAKRPMPTADAVRAFLAGMPAPVGGGRFRVVPPFRVVPGTTDTLPVLGNRRTVALTA